MNFEVRTGEKVLLDLGIESFIGKIHSIDKNRARILLKDVENFQTKMKYNGIQMFFISNIKSVTPIPDKPSQINDSRAVSTIKYDGRKSLYNLMNSENEDKKGNNKNLLTEYEWNKVDTTLKNIKVINQNDSTYFSAIKDLNNQQHIVILIEDIEFGRHNTSSVITAYAPDSKLLYIFDMVYLREMFKEFKEVFHLEKPKKIMFDSRPLCDYLKYEQNVDKITGVFDVLVAYLVTFKDNKSLNLISCIQKYFALPENYFNMNIKYRWRQRPLCENHTIFTAKKAIFLYKLYEYFLHEKMLTTFYETCKIFSETYYKNDDETEVAYLMSTNDETAIKLAQETNIKLSFSINNINDN